MTRRYSSLDVEYEGNFYKGIIPKGAFPSIVEKVPEFFSGLQLPSTSEFTLANIDNAITALRKAGGLKRGKRVRIRKGYGSLQQGMPVIDSDINIYRGLIDSGEIGRQARFPLLAQDIDIFDLDFPIDRITVDLFPNAFDLEFVIPFLVGTCRKVPLALILAQKTPTVQYQYLVGYGDLTIDNVYRDKRVLSKYTGTAQAGASSTITLAASDTRNDDFYNELFVEITSGTGAGQIRRITDYTSSTKIAAVTPNWTTTPNGTSVYSIKEYKKINLTVGGVTHTAIEFAIVQQDESGNPYRRDRMSADITGLQTERNPSKYVEKILGFFPIALNTAAFTTAKNDIDTIGNLFIDGGLSEPRRLFDLLDQVALIGRMRLKFNDAQEIEPEVDKALDTIHGKFKFNDNIIEIGTPTLTPLSQLWKTLAIRYRKFLDQNDFRLTTAKHNVNTAEGRIDQVLDFDLIDNKTTADKVCDYLAKRKNNLDEIISVTLDHEARELELGQMSEFTLDIPNKVGNFQYVEREILGIGFGFGIVEYNEDIFVHSAGAEPSDPASDDIADFTFTPPNAVSSFSHAYTIESLNVSAKVDLTWTNPTTNFKEVLIEYKKNADSLWISLGKTSGTAVTITALDVGTAYDFRATSFNDFDLSGGVAKILNQVSSGDTNPPAVPGTPTASRKLRTWRFEITDVSGASSYDWEVATSAGSLKSTYTKVGTVIEYTEPGTSSITLKARVRSRDLSNNTSSFSSYSSSVASEQVGTGDVGDSQITNPKVGPFAITDGKINNMSFGKITAGSISTSGVINLTNGADMNLSASASGDSNLINFKTSGGSIRLQVGYSVSSNSPYLRAVGSNFGILVDTGFDLSLGSIFSGAEVVMRADMRPNVDNNFTNGTASFRWQDLRSVLINGADYGLFNGYYFTEAYQIHDPREIDGVYLFNDKEESIAFWDEEGNVHCKGKIHELDTIFCGRKDPRFRELDGRRTQRSITKYDDYRIAKIEKEGYVRRLKLLALEDPFIEGDARDRIIREIQYSRTMFLSFNHDIYNHFSN